MRATQYALLLASSLAALPSGCPHVDGTYTDLPEGTSINLTSTGTVDWVKWGNGEQNPQAYSTVRKTGVSAAINSSLSKLGSVPPTTTLLRVPFSHGNLLKFQWTDGNVPPNGGSTDTAVSETISPPQFSYPLGLGCSFTCAAADHEQI